MVYAAVKACPVPWGTLKSYDDSAIKNRPGILAVVALKAVPGKTDNSDLQDAVAVVADSWWRAKNALEEITIEWDYGPYAHASTASQLDAGPPAPREARRAGLRRRAKARSGSASRAR